MDDKTYKRYDALDRRPVRRRIAFGPALDGALDFRPLRVGHRRDARRRLGRILPTNKYKKISAIVILCLLDTCGGIERIYTMCRNGLRT